MTVQALESLRLDVPFVLFEEQFEMLETLISELWQTLKGVPNLDSSSLIR